MTVASLAAAARAAESGEQPPAESSSSEETFTPENDYPYFGWSPRG